MVHITRMPKTSMLAAVLALGCSSSSQGTEPHDMSAAQHERAAGGEEVAADQHGAQYDPGATAETTRCAKAVCWSADTNPTAEHKTEMARHRELAEQHRAAAQALRDAEAKACVGVAEEDRDTSPFFYREDITSVSEIKPQNARGKAHLDTASGARAVFRAVPGLTAEWLQREVDCHLARAAAMGHNDMPEMAYCPLMLKGVTAKVSSTGDGFAIDVLSADGAVAKEALRRMQTAAKH